MMNVSLSISNSGLEDLLFCIFGGRLGLLHVRECKEGEVLLKEFKRFCA